MEQLSKSGNTELSTGPDGTSSFIGGIKAAIRNDQAINLEQMNIAIASGLSSIITSEQLDTLVNAGTFVSGIIYNISDAATPAPQYVSFMTASGSIMHSYDRYTSELITWFTATTRLSQALTNDAITTVAITDADVDDIMCVKLGTKYYKRVLINDTINIKAFGVTGLGVVDEATQANVACQALRKWHIYGATIFVPAGQYLCNSTVVINSPIAIKGVGVMRYTTAANFDYTAASYFFTTSATPITLFSMESGRGISGVAGPPFALDFRTPSIESIHFKDHSTSGYLSTLLLIEQFNHARVSNCTFTRGAIGVKCDGGADDASWCDFTGNIFAFNDIGFLNTTGISAGVPTTDLTGGAFLVGDNQIGFQNDSATYVRLHQTKFDVRIGGTGVLYKAGGRSELTDLNFEMGPIADADTTAIKIDPSASSSGLNGITITNASITANNSLGTGIKIIGGPSANFPTCRISIIGGSIANTERGIWLLTGTGAINIVGVNFTGCVVAAIQADAGSYNNLFTNITNNVDKDAAGGIVDNGNGSILSGYSWRSGGSMGKSETFEKVILVDNTTHSHTGNTTETTVYTGLIKAGTIGNNGYIDIDAIFSNTNSVGNKTFKIKFDSTQIYSNIVTTTAFLRVNSFARWRNSSTSILRGPGTGGGFGVPTATAHSVIAVSNLVDIVFTITVQLSNAADVASLESVVVKGRY